MKNTIVTSYPINSEPVIKNRLQSYIDVLTQNGFFVTLISGDCDNPVFSFDHDMTCLYAPKPNAQGQVFLKELFKN